MDTTNYNSAASMPLDEQMASKDRQHMNAGATALAGGAVGSVIPLIIGKIKDTISDINSEIETVDESESSISSNTEVAWADGNIEVATGVNDSMSFNEAFAAARNEVGAGGAFEWRGNVYGTYYAEEWNDMTPEAKAEYNNHFSWNNIDSSTATSNHHTATHDNIEVVSVDQPTTTNSEIEVVATEPEIEVLGVVHEMQTGRNLGGISVDGQEVFLIDVDGDMEFDLMASDLNHNNIIDDGEIVDIHGQGMTVNHLGGISEVTENFGGEEELPDYMADNTYEI